MRAQLFLFFIFFILFFTAFAFAQDKYILGPGDVLEIHAWDSTNSDLLIVNPVLSGLTTAVGDPHSVIVSRDGKVYIPLIGVLKVAGMEIERMESILLNGLLKFSRSARVSVMVKIPKKIRVTVAGEVKDPGVYEIPDGRAQDLTVLNYIKNAGGLTADGNREGITVIRSNGISFEVNLRKLVSNADLSQNVVLNDGDSIVVPQAVNKVYVLGYVNSPGGQKYIEGATVSDYVAMAGGAQKNAASDNIGIIRGDASNPIVKKIKLNKVFNFGKDDATVAVMPGDIIYVPQSWYFNWADISFVLVGVRDARDATLDMVKPGKWKIND